MRTTVFYFLTALVFISCSNFDSNYISTKQPTGNTINGKKEGEWKTYYTNGQLAMVENYRNDTLHGKSLIYDENGKLSGKGQYKMGIKVDSVQMFFSNGQLNLEEWKDSNGKTQGQFKIYHQNGQLSQIGYMKNDILDDTCKTFFENGQLKTLEYYKDKKKEGIWQYFSDKGILIRTEYYNNDKLVSYKE